MSRLKRLLALTGGTGVLAALALAGPAHADKVVGACVISGEAKMSDKQDPSLGVRLVGGKGSFTFTSLAVICVGFSKGVPDAQVVGVSAAGVYENVICGTGKAWGTVTGVSGPTKYVNLIKGKKFAIHFLGSWPAASTGVFFWHKTKAPKGPIDFKDDVLDELTKPTDGGPKPKSPKDWHPAGLIRLDLSNFKQFTIPSNPFLNCTKGTTVTATVFINEA